MNDIPPFETIKWVDETKEEFIGRCPLCGDSQKHKHKGHLYISKTYPIFKCFRCGEGGLLTTLEKLLNEKCKRKYSFLIKYDLLGLDVKTVFEKIDDIYKTCIYYTSTEEKDYFCKRCNVSNVKDDDMILYSIFPHSLGVELLKRIRGIDFCTRTWTLSVFGTILNGRAHDTENDSIMRYINGKVEMKWSKYVNNDVYMIRNEFVRKRSYIDTLVIAEGVYDIVPIYMNRYKYGLRDDSCFSACLCSSYDRSEEVFRMIFNSQPKNIIVFADRGITREHMISQFKKKMNWQNVTIYYPKIKDWNEAGPIDFTIKL